MPPYALHHGAPLSVSSTGANLAAVLAVQVPVALRASCHQLSSDSAVLASWQGVWPQLQL
jgi:hypothetical protein